MSVTENQQIRAWARERGITLPAKGPIRDEVREQWEHRDDEDQAAELDGQEDMPFTVTLPGANGSAAPEGLNATESPARPAPGQSPGRPAERKPVPPPGDRRGLFARKPRTGKPPTRRRVSIENVVSGGWGLAALALVRKPEMVPVGRVLQMQAPVAGIIVEDVAKGTLVDRILQPFARAGESGEKALALAGPPLLVGIMSAQPELYPVLLPILKMSMMAWLEVAEPAMKKAQKRSERLTEQFGDVDLDAMIAAIWEPVPGAGVPSEDEEANIRKARGE